MICHICHKSEPTPQALIDAQAGAPHPPRYKYLCREHGRIRHIALMRAHKKRMVGK